MHFLRSSARTFNCAASASIAPTTSAARRTVRACNVGISAPLGVHFATCRRFGGPTGSAVAPYRTAPLSIREMRTVALDPGRQAYCDRGRYSLDLAGKQRRGIRVRQRVAGALPRANKSSSAAARGLRQIAGAERAAVAMGKELERPGMFIGSRHGPGTWLAAQFPRWTISPDTPARTTMARGPACRRANSMGRRGAFR